MDKQFLITEYNKSVADAWIETFTKKNLKKAIDFCQYAGYLAWTFPFLENFCDEKLENIISAISKKFDPIEYVPQNNRIVFYNSQIIDNGALTEQYLDYFIENDYQVLFIIPDIKNTRLGKTILDKISHATNVKLYISEKKKSIEKIHDIRSQISLFNAQYCFLHFVPNDVIGCVAFMNISCTKTFYIVHNDHTFWIGKRLFDYFIEFRHLGISLALERRGVPLNKILYIPFYPIKNEEAFKGFPFDRTNKIVGISGANLYKYLIDPELNYFYLIKDLIAENPNFVFCLCGLGNSYAINQFIETNNLQERFFYLGHRSDFYNVIGQCDILFESYPMKGGLTPLFATEQKVPVVGISSSNTISGSLEEFLNIEAYKQPSNFKEFKAEATKLITDAEYRKELGQLLSNNRYNKKDFTCTLSHIFNDNLNALIPNQIKKLDLDDNVNLKQYLTLKESTFENLMRTKLFIIKSSIPLISRLKLMNTTIMASNTKGLYGVLRTVFLAIYGR